MLIHVQLLNRELVIENGFLDKLKDNATIQIWSEKTQQEKGDNLTKGYVSELWDFTRISNPTYSYFTFGKVDLVPIVEGYTTLLRFLKIQANKAYSRAANVSTFLKRLMSITSLNTNKKVDVFALSIYGLVIFPKASRHIDEVVSDLFDRLDKRVTPVPTILAEIFRSLNEDVEWRAPWMIPDEILYRCGDFDWVPLLGIYGVIGYAHLLVLRVNDNVLVSNQENTRSIEEHLQAILSELEIVKQDFENRSSELGRKIKKLEEEKIQLGLDVDVQKLEAEKMRKGKNKAEEDLNSLKIDYKKLRLSIRTVSEVLETNNEHWKEQLQCSKGQIRDRDHIMDEAVTQVREVADHLQTLAVQADMLSLRYESESDRGR
ncbi:hypothetical protein Godav_015369 [Gossypium davidsonii]|uniref:DUF7745 domain-containing protein n=1 Tax=Gossypium davidsonii TaxID=34287 RepID=A0A7J8RN64_GOSDV|nr:hypothetical protein [Gossypium davidsonii]